MNTHSKCRDATPAVLSAQITFFLMYPPSEINYVGSKVDVSSINFFKTEGEKWKTISKYWRKSLLSIRG